MPIRVTIWNEYRHEKKDPRVGNLYPQGIHAALGEALTRLLGDQVAIRLASLDEPEHGLTDAALDATDVLLWWGHMAHKEVADAVVERVHKRVLAGMGLIVLHSGHYSKIFRRLMGTDCGLRWREVGEKERVWNIAPGHPITQGIGEFFEVPHSEMYGEYFDIPQPDESVFISWYEGGDVFRSGNVWARGKGRVFYFSPGHESYPIYYQPEVQQVIANGVMYVAPRGSAYRNGGRKSEPLSPITTPDPHKK